MLLLLLLLRSVAHLSLFLNVLPCLLACSRRLLRR
jgi:hypothetical protein